MHLQGPNDLWFVVGMHTRRRFRIGLPQFRIQATASLFFAELLEFGPQALIRLGSRAEPVHQRSNIQPCPADNYWQLLPRIEPVKFHQCRPPIPAGVE